MPRNLDAIIRGVNAKAYREFKARASRLGLRLGEALKLAMESWSAEPVTPSPVAKDVDNEAYRRMRHELIRRYPGKHIAIAAGKLAAVSDSLDELASELRKLKVSRALTVEVEREESGEGGEWLWGSIAQETASGTTSQ